MRTPLRLVHKRWLWLLVFGLLALSMRQAWFLGEARPGLNVMLAGIAVNTTADGTGGPNCTLRDALTAANNDVAVGGCNAGSGADTISFSVTGTINLTGALPDITQSLTINGPGAHLLTVRRNTGGDYRIFHIPGSGLNIALSGLSISNGKAGDGGGIRSFSNLTLTDCAVNGNEAENAGGGVYLGSAGGNFSRCTFSGNTAGRQGGGVNFEGNGGQALRLSNCTISDNTVTGVGGGGGILNISFSGHSTLEAVNCTIAGNTATSANGGGVRTDGNNAGNTATTRLRNTIIADNSLPNMFVTDQFGVITSLGNNLTNGNGNGFLTEPSDRVNANPLLGPLADNGGPTPTRKPASGSPALNTGHNCVLTNACATNNLGFNLTTDQRGAGFQRLVGSAVDIGAYEEIPCPASFTVNTTLDTVDTAPGNGVCADAGGLCSLRAALQEANALPACGPLTINFSVTGIINLTGALPNITRSLTINGPGAHLLTVRRNTGGDYRIFNIPGGGVPIAISGLSIRNGKARDGGGISSFSNLTLTECAVTGNEATAGGGVALFADGSFSGCTFSGNTVSDGGGGIFFQVNSGRTLRLTNCTISDNTATGAGQGVGIRHASYSGNSTLEVVNCTITGNTSATTFGGGVTTVGNGAGNTATTRLRNTIIAGNTAPNLRSLSDSGGFGVVTSLSNNLTSDNGSGFLTGPGDLINTNPLLAPLANYGGPTPTQALLPGSPASNAGNNCVLTANGCGNNNPALTTDQRGAGFHRQTGGTVDIGAFESRGFTLAIAGGDNQTTPPGMAFAIPLAVNVTANGAGEPVNGGQVTFTPPISGASCAVVNNPAIIGSGTATSGTVTANATTGTYHVAAGATGATSINFALTNACQVVEPPRLAINDVTQNEGNAGVTNFVFTVTLTGAQNSCLPVTVNYATANGTAMAGSDYTATSGTLTFTAPHAGNSVTQTISVPVTGDTTFEQNETFFVNLTTPTHATFRDAQGQGTINNDDTAPPLPGCATPSFAAATNFAAGDGPISVALADFNLDSHPDLAVANADAGAVSVLLGNGAGGFGTARDFGVGSSPFSVAAGDFNRDGKPDLAVANPNANNVAVLLGDGLGGFGVATHFSAGPGPISVAVGDFNLDGKPDLAVANVNNNVSVLLGNGMGSFGMATPFVAGQFPRAVAVGDFNGDSKPDLVVANNNSNNVSVLLGDGMGSFGSTNDFAAGTQPVSVVVGDFNRDGKADLAVANNGPGTVSVLLGNGAGGFGAAQPFGVGSGPFSVAVGDFNRDLNSDLAVSNYDSNNVSVLLGDGLGSFGTAEHFNTGSGPLSVAVGDFDHSGLPDLAVANFDADNVSVLLNTCIGNTAPTLLPIVINHTAGNPSRNYQIAGTFEREDNLNELQLAISRDGLTFDSMATINGVTVRLTDRNADAPGTNPNAEGIVFADIEASCAAMDALFTLRVTDSGGLTATQLFSVKVDPYIPAVLYYDDQTVTAGTTLVINPAIGPSNYGASNPLVLQPIVPGTGLSLSLNQITGQLFVSNATLVGSYTVTVTAIHNCGGRADTIFTVNVVCPTVTLAPANLPNGVRGTAYSQTLTASPGGTTYSYAVTLGALPPGLTLNAVSGLISGTPSAGGNYTFAIKATGFGSCTKTQSYSVLITGTCASITLDQTSLPGATAGAAYNQTITANPAGTYTFAVTQGALPTGLSLSSTGALTGTPTQSGTYSFKITATGASGCTGSRSYVVSVSCGTLSWTPAALPSGTRGLAYSQQLSVSPANSATFSLLLGSLPPGFALSSSGVLSGTTSQAGTFNFTVKALAGSCQTTKQYTLLIGTGTAARALSGDYDGDGKSDPVLWSGKDGTWRIVRSGDGQSINQRWGTAGDVSLLGDYDGDGKTDLAVFRPADGTFYVKRSSDSSTLIKAWGLATDVPVPGDYDGDGKTDLAVWRGGEGNWYIVRSSDGMIDTLAWGASYAPYFDVAAPGDYDGDGKTDLAVFRRSTGTWYIKRSSDGQATMKAWGLGTDVPVAADYDGDGKTDIAVWRGGVWYIWQSASSNTHVVEWGANSAPYFDQAAPGDYDGDGQADVAVWRVSAQTWYIRYSTDGSVLTQSQGQAGDAPVSARRQ